MNLNLLKFHRIYQVNLMSNLIVKMIYKKILFMSILIKDNKFNL